MLISGVELEDVLVSGVRPDAILVSGVQVWPTGPEFVWYDDFSTVDPRWSGGSFTPPGFTVGIVVGPIVPLEFEMHYSVTWGAEGTIGVSIIDDQNQVTGFLVGSDGSLTPYLQGQPQTPFSAPLGATSDIVMIRSGGTFSIEVDGVPRGSFVDGLTRESYIYLIGFGSPVIHSLGVLGDGWGWAPWTAGANLAPLQPAGSNAYTTHASFVAPADMVLDLATSVTWRGTYASQRVGIAIDGFWAANIQPGTQAMAVAQRAFVPEGSLVEFITANNTTLSARWIDAGNWSAKESQYGPQMTGPLVQHGITVNTWARAHTWRAHKSMTVQASITGFSWAQATSASDRFIRICLNGTPLAQSADEGTSVSATMSVNPGDAISFEARSESGTASFRDITAGTWSVSEV